MNLLVQTEVRLFTTHPMGGEASARVETFVMEILDGIIPGTTSDNYRDYFTIELCDGYWELGEPTGNTELSWGQVKALYASSP